MSEEREAKAPVEVRHAVFQERQRIINQLFHYADTALGRDWYKPVDVSMQDAREIAQDAIRVVIELINEGGSDATD